MDSLSLKPEGKTICPCLVVEMEMVEDKALQMGD